MQNEKHIFIIFRSWLYLICINNRQPTHKLIKTADVKNRAIHGFLSAFQRSNESYTKQFRTIGLIDSLLVWYRQRAIFCALLATFCWTARSGNFEGPVPMISMAQMGESRLTLPLQRFHICWNLFYFTLESLRNSVDPSIRYL